MRAVVSLDQLQALGETLGKELDCGAVVWLQGDLGSGKTTLVQAIARGLGVAQRPTSPTYGLVHRYEGTAGPVFHVDCYRLKRPDEARDLDWEGLASGAALLIEWPERAGPWALEPNRTVRLGHDPDPDRRWIEVDR